MVVLFILFYIIYWLMLSTQCKDVYGNYTADFPFLSLLGGFFIMLIYVCIFGE